MTGKVDGDFTTKRLGKSNGAWADWTETITEEENGYYGATLVSGNTNLEGDLDLHLETADPYYVNLKWNVEPALSRTDTSLRILSPTLGLPSSVLTSTTTEIELDSGGTLPGSAADVVGCSVFCDLANSGAQSVVVAYDTGTTTLTVFPPLPAALDPGMSLYFKRPTATLLDHPDGVDTGLDLRLALTSIADDASTAAGNAGLTIAGNQRIQLALMLYPGGITVASGATDTDVPLTLAGGITLTATQVVGCYLATTVVGTGATVPRIVVAFNEGTQTATVAPALDVAPAETDEVLLIRPTPTLLDHPDGVATGFNHARTLRKIGSAVAAKSSGAPASGAGSQVFRDLTDSSDEFTSTFDGSGNRSGITHHD